MPQAYISDGSRNMAKNLNDLLDRWRLRHTKDEPKQSRLSGVANIPEIEEISPLEKFIVTDTITKKLSHMTRDDLGKLLFEVTQKQNDARAQINLFISKINGDPGKNRWYIEAAYVRDAYNSLSEAVRMEMGRKHKTEKAMTFTVVFINVAEEMLSKEQFLEIKQEADKRFKLYLSHENDRWSSDTQ